MNPVIMPMSGASTMNTTVLRMPAQTRTENEKPLLIRADPTSPPIRACEDDVGRPQYQVMMSQALAAMRVAAMTRSGFFGKVMMPLPMVAATVLWKTRKAMKLKKAAHMTACQGDSTRVETMVATELAASWNPFR